MMNSKCAFFRNVVTTLRTTVVLAAVGAIAASAALAAPAAPAPLTVKAVLDADVTLPSKSMELRELSRLFKEQLGVDIACYRRGAELFVRPSPGRHKVRDVLAGISASLLLTSEVLVARGRAVICLWRKPDGQLLAEMKKRARSDDALERSTAALWLKSVGGRDAFVQLLQMPTDPNVRVRNFAAASVVDGWTSKSNLMWCVAPKGMGMTLLKSVESEPWPPTRSRMLGLVHHLCEPRMLPFLKKQLENANWVVPENGAYPPAALCGLIARIGGLEAEEILLATVDRVPARDMGWFVQGLGVLGTDRTIAKIREMVDAEMAEMRARPRMLERTDIRMYHLAVALARSKNPVAVIELKRILQCPGLSDYDARRALESLASFDTPEAQAACRAKFRAVTDPAKRGNRGKYLLKSTALREELFGDLARGPDLRRHAAYALSATQDPRLVPVLVESMRANYDAAHVDQHEHTYIGGNAIATLGRIGNPEAEAALMAMVRGKGKPCRFVFQALCDIFSPTAREALRDALQSPDVLVRNYAAAAIARRPVPPDLEVLLACLEKERATDVREGIAEAGWLAVALIGGKRAAGELRAELARGSFPAACALVVTRDSLCIGVVRKVLSGNDAKQRKLLLGAFEKHSLRARAVASPSTYYAVRATLTDLPGADEKRKLDLLAMLAWTHDPRGTDVLCKVLVDLDESVAVRLNAAAFLIRHDDLSIATDPAAGEPLRHAYAHDPHEKVKREAGNALMRWGVSRYGPVKMPAPKNLPDGR
jgi:HEAT repeat protein